MQDVLKMFFELPNVFKEIYDYLQKETSNVQEGVYSSIFSGSRWKEISKLFRGRIYFPIFIYYDDFEVCNPLSTAAGKYKIGGMYFSIPCIPDKYRSMLQNVFFHQFIFTENYKSFSNEECFNLTLQQFKSLFEDGVQITINGEPITIYFVLFGLPGDNLGVNSFLEYPECFSADFWC